MTNSEMEKELKARTAKAITDYQQNVGKYLIDNGITEDKWNLLNLDQKCYIINKTTELLNFIATIITEARHDAIMSFDPIGIVLKAGEALELFAKLATMSEEEISVLEEVQKAVSKLEKVTSVSDGEDDDSNNFH